MLLSKEGKIRRVNEFYNVKWALDIENLKAFAKRYLSSNYVRVTVDPNTKLPSGRLLCMIEGKCRPENEWHKISPQYAWNGTGWYIIDGETLPPQYNNIVDRMIQNPTAELYLHNVVGITDRTVNGTVLFMTTDGQGAYYPLTGKDPKIVKRLLKTLNPEVHW